MMPAACQRKSGKPKPPKMEKELAEDERDEELDLDDFAVEEADEEFDLEDDEPGASFELVDLTRNLVIEMSVDRLKRVLQRGKA